MHPQLPDSRRPRPTEAQAGTQPTRTARSNTPVSDADMQPDRRVWPAGEDVANCIVKVPAPGIGPGVASEHEYARALHIGKPP